MTFEQFGFALLPGCFKSASSAVGRAIFRVENFAASGEGRFGGEFSVHLYIRRRRGKCDKKVNCSLHKSAIEPEVSMCRRNRFPPMIAYKRCISPLAVCWKVRGE
jgi:hypothetical protein